MILAESAQNYLETILILKKKFGEIKAIDIVNHLDYSKPSVSNALKQLKEKKLVNVNDGGYISLTKNGLKIASDLLERHFTIAEFFMKIGVCNETALEDSCKIEHILSEESYEKLKEHLYNLDNEK